ncbi:nucleosome-remodeling factor subunit BPTF-like protein [Corchorus olitorius]|uniref:Nucleosome-remodeling factor subunit BPTF-like protein n=1 Tax=Corchorus olitorius TaxID=93759 RepID=A0A1R3IA71_9ROSI|nr:nucleosome-remodeling factor subunit BPTF-like protein [Corchorus olitorius]
MASQVTCAILAVIFLSACHTICTLLMDYHQVPSSLSLERHSKHLTFSSFVGYWNRLLLAQPHHHHHVSLKVVVQVGCCSSTPN